MLVSTRLICWGICSAWLASSHAGNFDFSATMNGQVGQGSFDTAEEAANTYYEDKLKTIFPTYSGIEAINSVLNFRGMPIQLAFPLQGSTRLTFQIPILEINESFTGATRNDSRDLLKEYLKNRTDLLEKMARHLVAVSPVDPIAGNPNSLMSRAVSNDAKVLWLGARSNTSTVATSRDGSHRFGIGANYKHMKSDAVGGAKEMESDSYNFPLSYSYQFPEANHELIVDVPLGYTSSDGAKGYDGSLGVFYRRPIFENWVVSITGAGRGTYSRDLAGAAAMGSGAIASSYVWRGDVYSITLGNMLGYYKALRLTVDGKSFDPGIANTVFHNGLLYARESPWKMGADPLTWEAYIVDSRYSGTNLFNNYQTEVGFTLGTLRAAHSKDADLRFGFSFTKGENAQGWQANFGAWF
ncbi:hypothetical protein ACFQNF_09985 [Iodobacter arcticus]|uniref:Uncharacterized protein n=1 Tax=Iodobacter arcticus TaxID=590593 RepID=A0ABW2QWX4_9NEIS